MLVQKKFLLWFLLITLCVSSLVACGEGADEPVSDTPNEEQVAETDVATEEPTATPEPPPDVPIVEEIELLMLEGFPVQINAIIKGQLAYTCMSVDEVGQSREDNQFNLTVTATKGDDENCEPTAIGHEKIVNLDVEGLPAGIYSVVAEGISTTFILSADNASPTEVPSEPAEAPAEDAAAPAEGAAAPAEDGATADDGAPDGLTLTGQIWHDLCATEDDTGATPTGCVAKADNSFVANGRFDAEEPGLVGVTVDLLTGECPGTETVGAATTDDNGAYVFRGLDEGLYCISINEENDPNATILLPGAWTQPANNVAEMTVEISAETAVNSTAEPVDFGWDYANLPAVEGATDSNCIEFVGFGGDITIPDDAPIEAGSQFVKTWRIVNGGGCTWGSGYALQFVSGDQMEAPDEVPLPGVVGTGETIDVSITMTAPEEAGTYRGDWQLRRPDEALLPMSENNDSVWLQITVVDAGNLISIPGFIWNDYCDSDQYTFGVDDTLPPGCVENLNGTVRGDGIYDSVTEYSIADVIISVGEGICSDEELLNIQTTVSDADGNYSFTNLQPADNYCVFVEVVSEENAAILYPGIFTAPAPGRSGINITPERLAEESSFDFGWDYSEEDPVPPEEPTAIPAPVEEAPAEAPVEEVPVEEVPAEEPIPADS